MLNLQDRIQELYALPTAELPRDHARQVFEELKQALNAGTARSAEPDADGNWHVNHWVKQGILLGFRVGALVDLTHAGYAYFDKDNLTLRKMALTDNVRVAPGGSSGRPPRSTATGY